MSSQICNIMSSKHSASHYKLAARKRITPLPLHILQGICVGRQHVVMTIAVCLCTLCLCTLLTSCSIKIGLAPITSIDYSKVKTIGMTDFENHAALVYAPLTTTFNQTLRDMFIQQTQLSVLNGGGDLELSGEITGYQTSNESVDASGYSSKVRLTLTVKVTYVNNTNHEEDFTDQTFTAYQTYDATESLSSVQDDLISVMVDDITEQIFNSTVANW